MGAFEALLDLLAAPTSTGEITLDGQAYVAWFETIHPDGSGSSVVTHDRSSGKDTAQQYALHSESFRGAAQLAAQGASEP